MSLLESTDHDHDRNETEGYRYTHTTLRDVLIEFIGQ